MRGQEVMQKTSEWLISQNSNFQSLSQKRKNKKAQTIAITGGKGGVGKTSVSLKVARELATYSRVLLIDCDYNLSNTSIKLGLPIENRFYSLLSSEKNLDECLYKEGNFHLLSASNGCLDLLESEFKLEEFVIDIINAHEEEYDYILLDCPAGIQKDNLTLNAYCEKRIMVVNPDKSSITDSYSLIKLLNQKFGIKDNHLVVNKYETKEQYRRVVQTISETVENFLGGRTTILGGIGKIRVEQSRFDEQVLSRGKNVHHKNFDKVLKKLTDELSRPREVASSVFAPSNQFNEQEVHLN